MDEGWDVVLVEPGPAGARNRRYDFRNLHELCSKAEFNEKLLTGIFQWLIASVLCFRALPYRLLGKSKTKIGKLKATKTDHTLPPWLEALASASQKRERLRISQSRRLPFGASLLLVAGKPLQGI